MHAVIETGGKQYRVAPGDVIDIELLDEAGDNGSEITFDRVLAVSGDDGIQIGRPALDGASVQATLVERVRKGKVRVFKFKRRKQYRRTIGHRQNMLRVRIDDITT